MNRTHILSIILIVFLSILIYSNSFENSFHYDDSSVIVNNPNIKNLKDIKAIILDNPARPFLTLSFALNYYFSKLDPFGYHLINTLLHSINAILIYFMMDIIVPLSPIPIFTSILFAIHPIQTESVTYISSRSGVLCTTFFLLSLICFAKFLNTYKEEKFKRIFFYACCFLSLLFAVGIKENAIVLPIIFILYNYFFSPEFYRALKGSPTIVEKNQQDKNVLPIDRWGFLTPHFQVRTQFLQRLKLHIPFLLVIPLTLVLRKYFIGIIGNPIFVRNFYSNLLTQFNAIIFNMRLLLFPFNLNVDHDLPEAKTIFDLSTLISIAIICIILFSAYRLRRVSKEVSFAIFWFFITILPSTVVPLQDIVAERWLYIPSIGFSIFFSISFWRIICRGRPLCRPPYWAVRDDRPYRLRSNALTIIASALIIICFSLATYQRNFVWKDEYSLWIDATRKSPYKARPYNNLGTAFYLKYGEYEKAEFYFKKALSLNKNYAHAYNNLASVYFDLSTKKGDKNLLNKAIPLLRNALQLDPNYSAAHYNLGCVYYNMERFDEAIKELKKATSLSQNIIAYHYDLGKAYRKKRLFDQAILEFKKTLALRPNYKNANFFLGNAYASKKLYNEAILQFKEFLRINPSSAETHFNLGNAYMNKGLYDDALREFEKAIELKPGYARVHNNLGNVYTKKGSLDEALKEFKEALKLNPSFADANNNLGGIYFIKGMYDKAISHFKKAIEINSNYTSAHLNLANAYVSKRMAPEAISEYKKVIMLDPGNVEAYAKLGLLYKIVGDREKAIRNFEKVLAMEPKNILAKQKLQELGVK